MGIDDCFDRAALLAMPIEGALWTRGLHDPDWLWPAPEPGAPCITFTTFASPCTEEQGRMARALPLLLTEVFQTHFAVRSHCSFLVERATGPLRLARLPPVHVLADLAPPHPGPRILVEGTLTSVEVLVRASNLDDGSQLARFQVPREGQDAGALCEHVRRRLVWALEPTELLRPKATPVFYRNPPDALRDLYACALERLSAQHLVASNVVSTDSLRDERDCFETYFRLVKAWPGAPDSARLLAVSGVCAATAYGSHHVDPYREIALEWLDRATPGGTLHRLAPAILKTLREVEALQAWLTRAPRIREGRYAAWMERVRAA